MNNLEAVSDKSTEINDRTLYKVGDVIGSTKIAFIYGRSKDFIVYQADDQSTCWEADEVNIPNAKYVINIARKLLSKSASLSLIYSPRASNYIGNDLCTALGSTSSSEDYETFFESSTKYIDLCLKLKNRIIGYGPNYAVEQLQDGSIVWVDLPQIL